MSDPKLTDQQRRDIAYRFVSGEKQKTLAEEFGVTVGTIVRTCKNLNAVRPGPPASKVKNLTDFASRAKSILWRHDPGKEKKSYEKWKARVSELASKAGGGLTKNEAIVRASKEFKCLAKIFREFDVREYDSHSESHAHVQHYGEAPSKKNQVRCEGVSQSFRESLRWAIDAAGETSRTGTTPETCPCNAAWYLYEQAINEPKDFLAKVGQAEAKVDAGEEERRNAQLSGKLSIAEIDGYLAELITEPEEERAEDAS